MSAVQDPYACPVCGQECSVLIGGTSLTLVCVPCQMRDMQKLAEWNAWARGAARFQPENLESEGAG